jgi:uncharacterized protein YdiU (UPF0061 family)
MPPRKLKELKNSNAFTKKLNPDSLTPNGPPTRTPLPSLRRASIQTALQDGPIETSEIVIKSSRLVRDSFYTFLLPDLVEKPTLLCISSSSLKLLEIDPKEAKMKEFAQILAGNKLLTPECLPFCHIYGGHQFGIYAGQLGDGRCITIADIKASGVSFELSLKGTGKTPYSRSGDGKTFNILN